MTEIEKALERLGFTRGQNRKEVIARGSHWFLSGLGYVGSGDLDASDLEDIKKKLFSGETFVVLAGEALHLSAGIGQRNDDAMRHKQLSHVLYAVDRNHIYKLVADAPEEGQLVMIGTVTEYAALGINEKRMSAML